GSCGGQRHRKRSGAARWGSGRHRQPRPRRGRDLPPRQSAGRTDQPGGERTVRILICEDSVLLREGLVRLLEDAGHEVVGALADTVELEQTVAGSAPDLCILDVRLPPTFTDEGIRAAHGLRASRPSLAILVLSQY